MMSEFVVWLDAAVSDLKISDDGVDWVNPTTEATGLEFDDLAVHESVTLHLQRTISASASYDPDVLNHLHAAWNGL